MSVLEEVQRELEVNGQKFTLIKDRQYGFWEVKSANYVFPEKYTTYPKAVHAATTIAERPARQAARKKKED